MSTSGHLKFQGTNRATFVGATSNIMFDTTTTSLGIGVTGTDHPSSNLYITGNAYVSSNIAVGGVLTMGTVNVVARHDLEAVTAMGNTTPLTVEFSNATTGIVTTGNVEVGKDLVVSGNVEVAKELTVTGNATVSSNLTVSGTGQTSTSSFDQAGALGSTLILKDDGSSVGNGGAIMFGASQGYFGAIKGGIDNGANNTAGRITFFTRPDWTSSTMSSAMTIKYDGSVGIGEDGPVNALHIRGSNPQLLIEGESNENANIDFSSGPSYRNRRHQIQTEHYALSGFATSNKMHFRVNAGGENTPSIRMTIRGDGNVGIGTNAPDFSLQVLERHGLIESGYWAKYMVGTGHEAGTTRIYFRGFGDTNNVNMYVNGLHSANDASDDRIKTDEVLVENATQTLLKLKPQTYTKDIFEFDELTPEEYSNAETLTDGYVFSPTHNLWRKRRFAGRPQKETGLIIQDIWYDAPELRHIIRLTDDAEPTEERPETEDIQQDPDYDSLGWGQDASHLMYQQIIPYLIKSNQELHARIQALENAS